MKKSRLHHFVACFYSQALLASEPIVHTKEFTKRLYISAFWGFLVLPLFLWVLFFQSLKYGSLTATFSLSNCFRGHWLLVLRALCCHNRNMESADRYTYHGPMRIIGSSVDFKHFSDVDEESAYKRYYGKVQVGRGIQQGCPGDPTKWCKTYVEILQCEYCEWEGVDCRSGGRTDPRRCIRDKYNIRLGRHRWLSSARI